MAHRAFGGQQPSPDLSTQSFGQFQLGTCLIADSTGRHAAEEKSSSEINRVT
jgi:hypothetical protein